MREQVRQLRAEGKRAFFLPLEALDEGKIADLLTVDDERAFNSWRTDDRNIAWLFLDAVDELKLTQGKLERVLRRVAKEIDGCLHRVHIVISCRPTDWRSTLDLAALRDAFPTAPLSAPAAASEELFLSALREPEPAKQSDKGERSTPSPSETSFVVLLPLDQTQIEAFARAQGVADVAAFMAELRKENAWSFARRPLDLSELIATWRGQGRLGTRAEQHEANVVARLEDHPDRPDQGLLTDVELRVGAERLALALSLTRTLTIRAPELSMDVEYALGVLDSASILPDWSEEKRQALLRRALFDPATYGRVKFHHRSVQEYLSARRLDELRKRGMSTKALGRLLFAERYGVPVVLPSMRPIAAWLALWDRHVQRELTRREPETLLSMGDPGTLPIPIRAELLRAFAQSYGSGGWRGLRVPFEEIRRLAHPELGSVVLDLWGQGPTNEDVRELLLDLMEQGRMHQCANVCEQAARDVNPLRDDVMSERKWFFKQRRASSMERSPIQDDERYHEDKFAFGAPRFETLYRRWLNEGDAALEVVSSRATAHAIECGTGRVECRVLPFSYRHLSPMVGSSHRAFQGGRGG